MASILCIMLVTIIIIIIIIIIIVIITTTHISLSLSLFTFTFIDPQKVTLETMGYRICQKNVNKYIIHIRKTKETKDVS
jgi:hypothetical protein